LFSETQRTTELSTGTEHKVSNNKLNWSQWKLLTL